MNYRPVELWLPARIFGYLPQKTVEVRLNSRYWEMNLEEGRSISICNGCNDRRGRRFNECHEGRIRRVTHYGSLEEMVRQEIPDRILPGWSPREIVKEYEYQLIEKHRDEDHRRAVYQSRGVLAFEFYLANPY